MKFAAVAVIAALSLIVVSSRATVAAETATLHVDVFNDANANNTLDVGEAPLPGVSFNFKLSPRPDGIDRPATSDANGSFTIELPVPASGTSWNVCPADPGYWSITALVPHPFSSVTDTCWHVFPVVAGENGFSIGVHLPVVVSGVAFNDRNADGVQQRREKAVVGEQFVYLSDGTGGADLTRRAETDRDGHFTITTAWRDWVWPGRGFRLCLNSEAWMFSPSAGPWLDGRGGAFLSCASVPVVSPDSSPLPIALRPGPVLAIHAFWDDNSDGTQRHGERDTRDLTLVTRNTWFAREFNFRTTPLDREGNVRLSGILPTSDTPAHVTTSVCALDVLLIDEGVELASVDGVPVTEHRVFCTPVDVEDGGNALELGLRPVVR
jgi:hypothetical protein